MIIDSGLLTEFPDSPALKVHEAPLTEQSPTPKQGIPQSHGLRLELLGELDGGFYWDLIHHLMVT